MIDCCPRGVAEPSLVLTPPETGTAEDDGLLTASEFATIDLDADRVILSACNTASVSSHSFSLLVVDVYGLLRFTHEAMLIVSKR